MRDPIAHPSSYWLLGLLIDSTVFSSKHYVEATEMSVFTTTYQLIHCSQTKYHIPGLASCTLELFVREILLHKNSSD